MKIGEPKKTKDRRAFRLFHRALPLLRVALLQFGLLSAAARAQPPAIAGGAAQNADALVRNLAARSANWIAPPATLENLEYQVPGTPYLTARIDYGAPELLSLSRKISAAVLARSSDVLWLPGTPVDLGRSSRCRGEPPTWFDRFLHIRRRSSR